MGSGGVAGAAAQGINVCTLMWMSTIMNYQYRYGGGLVDTTKKLYAEGGVPRFYRGLAPALLQAPMSRFGDTAANDGALTALETSTLPTAVKTMIASACAAGFRVFLMPVDAWKTTKQVEGKEGLKKLLEKTKKNPTALWQGSVAAMSATWVGHYPCSTPITNCASPCRSSAFPTASTSRTPSSVSVLRRCRTRALIPCGCSRPRAKLDSCP